MGCLKLAHIEYEQSPLRCVWKSEKLQKSHVNLYDHGARYYDPQLSRWHSPDPLSELYTSFSPYHYVGNNPVNFVDPDGMKRLPAPYATDNNCYGLSSGVRRLQADPNTWNNVGRFMSNPGPGIPYTDENGNEYTTQQDPVTGRYYYEKEICAGEETYITEEYIEGYSVNGVPLPILNEGTRAILMMGRVYIDPSKKGRLGEWWNNLDWGELSGQADDFFMVAAMADAQLPIGDAIGLIAMGGARLGKLAFGVNKYARIFYKANPRFLKYIGRGIMEVHHRIPQRYINSGLFPEAMQTSLSNLYGLPRDVHRKIVTPMWNAWSRANPNPSPADVMRYTQEIDRMIAPYINTIWK